MKATPIGDLDPRSGRLGPSNARLAARLVQGYPHEFAGGSEGGRASARVF